MEIHKQYALWAALSKAGGRSVPENPQSLYISMMKSALLKRLSRGAGAYYFAPPKSYGYPAYSILEENGMSGWICNFTLADEPDSFYMNQARWNIHDKLNNGTLILSYNKEEGSLWEFKPWHVNKIYEDMRPRTLSTLSDEKVMELAKSRIGQYATLELVEKGKNRIMTKEEEYQAIKRVFIY